MPLSIQRLRYVRSRPAAPTLLLPQFQIKGQTDLSRTAMLPLRSSSGSSEAALSVWFSCRSRPGIQW